MRLYAVLAVLLVGCNDLLGHERGLAAPSDFDAAASRGDGPFDAGAEPTPLAPSTDASHEAAPGTCFDPTCSDPDSFPPCGAVACPEGVLARDLAQPTALAVDDTSIYWNEAVRGRILQIPLKGGEVRVLVRGQANAVALTADGLSVYWAVEGEVRSVARTGGAVRVVAHDVAAATFIAADDETVYWVAQNSVRDHVLRGRKKTADAATPLDLDVAVGSATGLTVDSSSAYLTDSALGLLVHVVLHKPCTALSPCTPRALAGSQASPQLPYVHGAYVYWTNGADRSVMRAPVDGLCNEPPCEELLAKDQKAPTMTAVDDTAVYWLNAGTPAAADGALLRRDLSTGRVSELAAREATPSAMALTTTDVIWLNRGSSPAFANGTLRKTPKL